MKKRKNQQAQEENRYQIAAYLKTKKGTQKEASEVFGISLKTVSNVWKAYKKGGKKSLKSKKRGVKEGKKITAKQAWEIRELIKDKLPEQLKLAYGLWTREAVTALIQRRFGIALSRWQVGRYLKSWGFTPQKPIRKAFEQKPEKVQKWLEEEYPKIKEQAKKEKGVIYFGDETGCRSDHQTGRSYAPKGQTPIVIKTGQRFSVNMISAISNRGHLQFMILEGRFNSGVFLQFLKHMIRYSREKIFFITDNHPDHKTKMLQAWLLENKERIEVFFIPPYSPELNAQEYLNQDVKTNVVGKKRPINKEQLKSNIKNFMIEKKKNRMAVKKYFHVKHVKYVA